MNLKSILNFFSYWFLPIGIKNTLLSIYSKQVAFRDYSAERNILGKLCRYNLKFKDIHKGERCFILATGPSIKTQNLLPLKNEICISVSQFYLHKDIQTISPNYYVLAPSHPPFDFSDILKIFDGLEKCYSDNATYFLGYTSYIYSYYRFLETYPRYKNSNQYFINYSMSQSLEESNYSNKAMWEVDQSPFAIRTVIYSAIQVALYMGCKEIYLIGCDHDYLNDTSRVTNYHFYKEEDGISDAEHLSSFNTERWFEEYYFRWKQYRLIREYAQQKGCNIFNATEGGMLDVFPRVRLEDIVVY